MARVGLYPDAPKAPCVVGHEVSGVVDAVGRDVTRVAVGDRVFGMPRFGGYTDTLIVHEAQAFRMPAKMTFEEAAALPVVYLPAHHMMLYTGNLRPRSKVLLSLRGGRRGPRRDRAREDTRLRDLRHRLEVELGFLRELGVQHPIDNDADCIAEVRSLTGGRGVDLVLDPVGGKSWTEGYDLLAPAGRLVAFGLSAAASGKKRNVLHALGQVLQVKKWSPMKLMHDNKQVQGVDMGHLFGEVAMLAEQFESLVAMYEAGQIKPHVDRTFPFSEAAAAHHYIHDRKAKGKVLLIPEAVAS